MLDEDWRAVTVRKKEYIFTIDTPLCVPEVCKYEMRYDDDDVNLTLQENSAVDIDTAA